MKDAKGHGSDTRGGRLAKPIPGHHYHAKSDAELRYIIKDASEAEKATRGMSMYNPNSGKREDTAGKYSDQVNDAASVLAYRDRGGKRDEPNHGLIEGMQAKLSGDIAAGRMLHSGNPKSDPVPTHDSMAIPDHVRVQGGVPGGGQHIGRIDGQYYGRALNKAGRKIGESGPHPDHETAAKAAFDAYPKARGVSTSRGSYGMDIRFHRK